MSEDKYTDDMTWLNRCTGEEKKLACSVVAWNSISCTLQVLVEQYNNTVFKKHDKHTRHRTIQCKKLIIGMFHELDGCLDYWATELNERELLDDDIKKLKKEFKNACKKAGKNVLQNIRNDVAFHFEGSLMNPDKIYATFEVINTIRQETLNEILKAATSCGVKMRDKIIESMS